MFVTASDGPVRVVMVPSPIGGIRVEATPGRLLRVGLLESFDDSLANDALSLLKPGEDFPHLRRAVEFLERYFAGERASWTDGKIPPGTDFTRAVWGATLRIPFGTTMSYGGLARAVGRPGAARAVGNAMARNPLPILIPCHRVITSEGKLGGYGGSPAVKRWLLEFEGVKVR